ncbi:MAG: VCBS repeat-containing protein [Planctomycetota bacterium]|nr:MAG: VCBS repeat-containing protein [Planctomycetota bacterium]
MKTLARVLAVACTAAAAQGSAQSPAPFAGEQLPFGAQPTDLTRVDIDGNGKADLVALALGNSTLPSAIVFRLGDGAGGFSATLSLQTPKFPVGFGCADLDLDGDLDALVAQSIPSGTLAVWLGNGDGTFASPLEYPTGRIPTCVDLGDVNEDGRVDSIQGDATALASATVLPGDGAGGFGTPIHHAMGMQIGAIDLGDLDGDGDLDFGARQTGGSTVLFAESFQGGFSPAGSIVLSQLAAQIRLFDVDGDSDTDAVIGSQQAGYLTVARLSGTLPAVLQGVVNVGTDGGAAQRFTVGDVNADGKLDLVAVNRLSATAAVLLAAAPGTFGGPIVVPVVVDPAGVALLDANSDGKPDLAVSSAASGTLQLRLGLGGAAFAASQPQIEWYDGSIADELVLGDLEGNGRLDVVVATGNTQSISVLLGDPVGVPLYVSSVHLGAPVRGAALADVDLDGRADVVAVRDTFGTTLAAILTLLGTGSGGFGLPIASEVAPQMLALETGDFNGDGRVDALTFGYGQTAATYSGDGTGSFAAPIVIPTQCVAGDAAFGDLDLDGRLDVVLRGATVNQLSVLRGTPGGGFAPAVVYPVPVGDNFGGVAIGDLDGDGWPDVVTTLTTPTPAVKWLAGGAGGSLGASTTLTSWRTPVDVAVGDVDADGLADVVALEQHSLLAWWRGTGSGAFAPERLFQAAPNGTELALGDFDADGRPDVIAACSPSILLQRNLLTAPAGTQSFGSGTSGCLGTIGLTASASPTLGNASFALLATNAPPQATGIGAIAAVADVPGSSFLLPGLVLHVDPLAGPYSMFALKSTIAGEGRKVLPVPNDAQLLGASVHAQTYWLELPPLGCTSASVPFASSRGLTIAFQP